MNKTQILITANMLEMALDEFSNHTCNDLELENTEENLQFVTDMIRASDYPEDTPNLSRDWKKIYVQDWYVMSYCRKLLLKELSA